MEFFREFPLTLTADQLRMQVTVRRLPLVCASIERVLSDFGDEGEIYCLWGTFPVRREAIGEGVRFTLPTCPNALQWTVTCTEGAALLHCTINCRSHDLEFIDSIEQFLDDWVAGLQLLEAA